MLAMDPEYKISMEVNRNNNVTLVFKGTWDDVNKEPREPAISASVSINITPNTVAITDFDITKIQDSEVANSAYKYLEDNQKNILEKLLSWIQRFFGFNSELRLEERKKDDMEWGITPNN
jgi:hypothetical protein